MKKCGKCKNDMFDHEEVCKNCGNNQTSYNLNKIIARITFAILMISVIFITIRYLEQKETTNSSLQEETSEEMENNKYSDEDIGQDENSYVEEDSTTEENYNNRAYDTSKFIELSITDFNTLLNQNDNQKYFVLTASSYCSHCLEFVPKVNKSLEDYEYSVEYIDMTQVTTSEINTIRQKRGFSSFGSTPIVFVVQNGIAVDSSIGNVDYYNYISFLEKHGVPKKNSSDEIIIEKTN